MITAGDEYVTASPWAKARKLHVLRVIPNKGGFTVEYDRYDTKAGVRRKSLALNRFKKILEEGKWFRQK